jgi:DNA-binding transcriptional LysR family regulator
MLGTNRRAVLSYRTTLKASGRGSVRFLTLRYFNEVAKLGSIRKAADCLHVAPSAVSRQIAQLELELAAVLFERSKVGVQLTAAGEVLARHSHRIFRDLDRARSGIDDLRGLQRGEVSVWVIEGFCLGLATRPAGQLPSPLSRRLLQDPNRLNRPHRGGTAGGRGRHRNHFNAISRPEIEVITEYVEPISCLVAPTHEYANHSVLP